MNRSRSLLLVSLLVACSGGSAPPAEGTAPEGTAPEGTAPEGTVAPPEAPPGEPVPGSSVLTRAPSVATGCPATDPNAIAQIGTMHGGDVLANEILDVAGSPHRFPNGVNVGSVTLSIEPCALVLVGPNNALWVNAQGTLLSQGTAERPIVIRALDPLAGRGAWGGIYFNGEATHNSRLAHTTIANAGADVSWAERGAIWIDGTVTVAMNEVTISQSGGHGVSLRSHARFAPGSAGLHVLNSGAPDMAAGLVAFANVDAVSSLPDLTQDGNDAPDVVLVGDESPRVLTTQTWRNPGAGIRYRVRTDLEVRGPSGPVLAVAAGTTVAFDEGRTFYVGWDEDGGLVLDGGAEETRITLTSARREVSPGDWVGLILGDHALRSSTRLAFVDVVGAGAAPNWNPEHDCGQSAGASYALQIREHDVPTITHTRFRSLPEACVAIQRAFVSDAPTDFTAAAAGNDFASMGARCPQSFVEPASGCPDPVPSCP